MLLARKLTMKKANWQQEMIQISRICLELWLQHLERLSTQEDPYHQLARNFLAKPKPECIVMVIFRLQLEHIPFIKLTI